MSMISGGGGWKVHLEIKFDEVWNDFACPPLSAWAVRQQDCLFSSLYLSEKVKHTQQAVIDWMILRVYLFGENIIFF